ncbi:hypothetical protein AVEN_264592-1, partial [Araneus ventricosus]
ILKLVCNALVTVLKDIHLCVPSSKAELAAISAAFDDMWQFPMCVGALDGKHVKICPPPNSGSLYYNYKGDFSIVLMVLVDANLRFIFVDIGTNGRISDGGVWGKCKLKLALDRNTVNIPEADNLPLTTTKVPYVIVADDAFPLSINLMKPYPGRGLNDEERIFNYRLSRARRVSENAFGILAARFQIFKQRILTSPMNATKIVMACCALHNFLIFRNPALYIPASSIDNEVIENREIQRGNWRDSASEAFVPLLNWTPQVRPLFPKSRHPDLILTGQQLRCPSATASVGNEPIWVQAPILLNLRQASVFSPPFENTIVGY